MKQQISVPPRYPSRADWGYQEDIPAGQNEDNKTGMPTATTTTT